MKPFSDEAYGRLIDAASGTPLFSQIEMMHNTIKAAIGVGDESLAIFMVLNGTLHRFGQVLKGLWNTGDYRRASKLYKALVAYLAGEVKNEKQI